MRRIHSRNSWEPTIQKLLHNASVLARAYALAGLKTEAEELEEEVVGICRSKPSENHHEILRVMIDVSLIYSMQHQWAKAAELKINLLEKTTMHLGEDYPNTLVIMSNLLVDLRELGYLDKAEEHGLFVLENFRAKFGEDHPNTLISKLNLAMAYFRRDQFGEAERLQVEALETMRVKLGIIRMHLKSWVIWLSAGKSSVGPLMPWI